MGPLKISLLVVTYAFLYITQDGVSYTRKIPAASMVSYRHRGFNCTLCPPGYYRRLHCSKYRDTICWPCRQDTVMPFWNRINSCFPACTPCAISDSVSKCGLRRTECPCDEVYFDEGLQICRFRRKCGYGFGVSRQGTAHVICRKCFAGFYSNTESSTEPCRAHINCSRYNLVVDDPGNATHPRSCRQRKGVNEGINLEAETNRPSSAKFSVDPMLTVICIISPVLAGVLISFLVFFLKMRRSHTGRSWERQGCMALGHWFNKGRRRQESFGSVFEMSESVSPQHGDTCVTDIGSCTIQPTAGTSSQCNLQDERGHADLELSVFPTMKDLQIAKQRDGTFLFSAQKRTKSLEKISKSFYKRFSPSSHSHTICRSLNKTSNIRGIEKKQLVVHYKIDKWFSRLARETESMAIRTFCLSISPHVSLKSILPSYQSKRNSSNFNIEESALQVITSIPSTELHEVEKSRQVFVKYTNRKWDIALHPVIPNPSVEQEMICLDLVKDIKATNVNLCPTNIIGKDLRRSEQLKLWEGGSSVKNHKVSRFYRYDSRGGCLTVSPSAELTIPPKAIPEGDVYGVKGTPLATDAVADISALLDVERGEHIVSPLIDYEICDSKRFVRHTKLSVEHCVADRDALEGIKVYSWSQFDPTVLTEVPRQSKDNNVRQDTYFVVEEDGTVSIYTIHFTVYVTTCGKCETLQVLAKLYTKVEESQDAFNIHLYLCSDLATTKHYQADFAREKKEMGLKLCTSNVVTLPAKVFPDTIFDIELTDGNDGWELCELIVGGQNAFPLKQKRRADDFIITGTPSTPILAAEWTIKFNESTLNRGVVIQPVAEDQPVDRTILWVKLCPPISCKVNHVKSWKNVLSKYNLRRNPEGWEWNIVFLCVGNYMKREDSESLAKHLHISNAKVSHIGEQCSQNTPRFTQEICAAWLDRNPEKNLLDFIQAVDKANSRVAFDVLENVKGQISLVEDGSMDEQTLCDQFSNLSSA